MSDLEIIIMINNIILSTTPDTDVSDVLEKLNELTDILREQNNG